MSFTKKVVTTYSKSLFQNVRLGKKSKTSKPSKATLFHPSKVIVRSAGITHPSIFAIGEELALLKSIFTTSKKLSSFFQNPTYSEQQKGKILSSLFPGLSLPMKSFLKILVERTHLALLPEIADEYGKLLCKVKKTTQVRLIVASPLNANLGSLLLKTLQKITKAKEISFTVSYNPKLLGGLIVEYNSTAIDASLLRELSHFFHEG